MRWLVVLLLLAPVAAQDTIGPIDVRSDQGWPTPGPARSGSGTADDPYIVSDYIIERAPLTLDQSAPAIHVQDTTAHVIFENIQVVQSFDIAVHLHGVENLVFQEITVENAGRGLHIEGSTDVSFTESTIRDTGPDDFAGGALILASQGVLLRGVVVEDGEAVGIRVSTSDKVHIEGVAVRGHDGGMRIHSSGDVNLVGVAIQNNRGDGAWISNVTRLNLFDVAASGQTSQGGVNSGRGVVIWETDATIHGLDARTNGGAGAAILSGHSEIRASRFLDNGGPGLTVSGAASHIQAVEAHGNRGAGIAVLQPDRGSARVVSAQLHDNRGPGIYVEGSSGVHLAEVRSQHNGGAGIDVRESGNVSILGSWAIGNDEDGVYLWQVAKGQVVNTWAETNEGAGFVLLETADMRLTNNTAMKNQESGFVVGGANELHGNQALGNGAFGILVLDEGPTLKGNNLEGNVNGDDIDQQKESPLGLLVPLVGLLLCLRHQRP